MDLRHARLIAYDIESDKKRQRIARFLQARGLRIQKSVFLVDIRGDNLDKLKKELEKIQEKDGTIDIIPVCANCRRNSLRLGQIPEPAIVIMGDENQSAVSTPLEADPSEINLGFKGLKEDD